MFDETGGGTHFSKGHVMSCALSKGTMIPCRDYLANPVIFILLHSTASHHIHVSQEFYLIGYRRYWTHIHADSHMLRMNVLRMEIQCMVSQCLTYDHRSIGQTSQRTWWYRVSNPTPALEFEIVYDTCSNHFLIGSQSFPDHFEAVVPIFSQSFLQSFCKHSFRSFSNLFLTMFQPKS